MIILGLDTATPTASVALVEDGELVAETSQDKRRSLGSDSAIHPNSNHSEVILSLVQSILDRGKISLSELSGIAVSIGPGSFTGLRVGLATVKGIAFESGLPVVGVSTLHANAARVRDHEGIICSLLDARKQEVYAAIFHRHGESLTPQSEERVCTIGAAIESLRAAGAVNPIVVGDGAERYASLLTQAFGESVRISAGEELGSVAAQVAKLPWQRFNDHACDDVAELAPRYVRSPEAETRRAQQL